MFCCKPTSRTGSKRPRNEEPLAAVRGCSRFPGVARHVCHSPQCARGLRVVCQAHGARRPLFRRSLSYAGAMLISRLLRHPPNATAPRIIEEDPARRTIEPSNLPHRQKSTPRYQHVPAGPQPPWQRRTNVGRKITSPERGAKRLRSDEAIEEELRAWPCKPNHKD
jgi:hypothetical protein